jgi:hypothetical protein
MTMRSVTSGTLAILMLLTLPGAAASAAADRGPRPEQPTIGGFAAQLALLSSRGGAPAAGAAEILIESGSAAGRARAPLTEGAAAAMLKSVGIDAGTSAPGRLVSEGRAAALVRLVADRLGAAGGAGPTAAQASPATLDDCLVLRNHGECVTCCKAEGLSASSCAKACFVINKPSPSEPLP